MKQRPIKFNAWHIPTGRMFPVYSITPDEVFEDSLDGVGTRPTLPARRKDCLLLQFTGVVDKNGAELYEGHIIETRFPEPLEVRGESIIYNEIAFRDGSFGILGENNPLELQDFFGLGITGTLTDGVVVGNVFENRDLLARNEEDEDGQPWDDTRFAHIDDVVPLVQGDLNNWLKYQQVFIEMQKADGFIEQSIKATSWEELKDFFNDEVSVKDAFKTFFYEE